MVPPWITFRITGYVDRAGASRRMSFQNALETTFFKRAFVILAFIYLASWTATSVIAAMLVYQASYFLNVPEQASYLVLTTQGAALLSIPACVWMARVFDKPQGLMTGVGYRYPVLGMLVFLPRSAGVSACILACFCGPGIVTAAVIAASMFPDVVEVEQQDSGERRDGAYDALISFLQKPGTGLALLGRHFACRNT